MVEEIKIIEKSGVTTQAKSLLREIKRTLQIQTVAEIKIVKVYRIEEIEKKALEDFAHNIVAEFLNHDVYINKPAVTNANYKVEIGYKPGVMNPEIASLIKAAQLLKLPLSAVETSLEYHFFGTMTTDEIKKIYKRLLVNETIEQIIAFKPATLVTHFFPEPIINSINISALADYELLALSKQMQLSLNAQEMQAIKNYFRDQLREPTDAELETIAQTWSEHCYHKTFKASLLVDGNEKTSLFSRLKQTANKYQDNVISAFEDNAGAFRFYDNYAILAKVETHNSPSAIEPYGGAATGTGGVFRDIIGTGQGAKLIASTDIFCFAPPNLSESEIPGGCLHPDYLLRRVVAGVRDYGNRMGIPTNNGSVHFHPDFRAKPTVIVGAYGITPEFYAKKGKPEIGDLIVLIGGRTGRDGIHGATFSSISMTDKTMTLNASAVQIGNPIEEKRIADVILVCRDYNLIRAITDCGAGGLSSAIGEMGAQLGVAVQLEKIPLKYDGLAPWEIWISESQERMICAVKSEHVNQFLGICAQYNVEATVVGSFTGTGRLDVTYCAEMVCNLNMEFLHHGIPQKKLRATKPNFPLMHQSISKKHNSNYELAELFKLVLSDWNIASKESIVRQYDHMVQATNALLPYSGRDQSGPNDAAVLTPLLGKPHGLIISHGLNPILNRIDPYHGSMWAIVEALSNLVAVGGNVSEAALVDNFIWPYPDEEFLWMLDAAMDACVDAMNIFKIPFISGKDSLSSTYRAADGTALHIPPVLCISAIGKIPDVYKTVSSEFKRADSYVVLMGNLDFNEMAGSIVSNILQTFELTKLPDLSVSELPKRFSMLHALIQDGIILSCHDISEGGVAIAIAEMCFGSQYGAEIDISWIAAEPVHFLFSETAGCFVIEVAAEHIEKLINLDMPCTILGKTTNQYQFSVKKNNQLLINESIMSLCNIWQGPFKKVFNR